MPHVLRGILCALVLAAVMPLVTGYVTAQDAMTPTLVELADAERAFAKAATVQGIRDAFLEFFADDAVALVPEPASWKDRLRAGPAVPFTERELLWEPRVGDIASSAELGWLTGPSTFTNKKENAAPQHGNYLSVWRKQADGSWKVYLDIGSDSPTPVPFRDGFNRFEFGPRYTGKEGKAAATKALLERDRELNGRLAKEPPAVVYEAFLSRLARLHRNGMVPVIGRTEAVAWLAANAAPMQAATGTAESARSGDLGYSYGTYVTKDSPRKGAYMRLWSRTAEGRWLMVTEVLTPPAPKP